MKEYQIQKAVVKYLKLQYPQALYCASAGGLRTSITSAVRMKASGYIKGHPDLAILEPLGKYHSLYLEIKTEKGKPTREQLWWRNELNKRDFYCKIVYGYEEAVECIDNYLKGNIDES